MPTYKIAISEEQRATIQEALGTFINVRSSLPEAREARALWEMFQTLPHDEAEQVARYGHKPGETLHGFTL